MTPLLTIAIPTYNRVDCLRVLIERIIGELEKISDWESFVELVVVDNASTDGTNDYLADLKMRISCVVYRNAENLGMDGNFVRCFEVATGRWLWLCSDDDLPMVGAISLILDTLRGPNANCGLIYLPTRFHAGSLAENRERVEPQLLRVEGAHQFAARVNGLFTFITCIIANRQAFLAAVPEPDLSTLRGSFFVFFEWHLELLKRAKKFGYFPRPLMLARAENSRGYNFAQVFTQRFNDACGVKLSDKPRLRKLIVDGMRYRHLPNLFYKTRIGRNGNFDFDSANASNDYLRAYGTGPFYFLVMRPVFKFSPFLAKVALFFGRVWGKVWIEWVTRSSRRN
ncbi:glycosyltransferase family 2 protein [Comamonas terrigena]|uniref:glycosyltransferase family 2 protein n=1 Tax=Comamonas terrigena TaxID=32013 RepID=UPI00244CBB71|nr:glycosyltransferase family 2 protein [Comamonas terrigena]MDH1289691.1 glycosyltransferase family 2 protein [Comamonas terrigena]